MHSFIYYLFISYHDYVKKEKEKNTKKKKAGTTLKRLGLKTQLNEVSAEEEMFLVHIVNLTDLQYMRGVPGFPQEDLNNGQIGGYCGVCLFRINEEETK